MEKSKIYQIKMLLLLLVLRLRLNNKIREVEVMVEDSEVEEEGVGAITMTGEEELDIHNGHTKDSKIREDRNSISKINIEEEAKVEDVVVAAIIHSLGTKKTIKIALMTSTSFRKRVKNNTTIKEDVETSEDEVSEVKEVSSEVAAEVVEDSNNKSLMNNQRRQCNMILNLSQMSLFIKRLEQEAKSKLISETLLCH